MRQSIKLSPNLQQGVLPTPADSKSVLFDVLLGGNQKMLCLHLSRFFKTRSHESDQYSLLNEFASNSRDSRIVATSIVDKPCGHRHAKKSRNLHFVIRKI